MEAHSTKVNSLQTYNIMDETLSDRVRFDEQLYIFAFALFIIKNVLEVSSLISRPEWVDNGLIAFFLVVMIFRLLRQSYHPITFVMMMGFLLIVFYTAYTIKYYTIAITFLFIMGLQDIELRKVIGVSARLKSIIILFHTLVYLVNLEVFPSTIQFYFRDGILRHNFYLGHPNLFQAYVMWTCMEWLFLYYKKLRPWHLIGVWLINFFYYEFTDSNTSLIVATLTLVIIGIDRFSAEDGLSRHIMKAFVNFFSQYGFMIFSIFFYLIIMSYTKLSGPLLSIWKVFNSGLSGRLRYGAYAYDVYGVSLIGRLIRFPEKVQWRDQWLDDIIFDNTYIWMIIIVGIFYMVVISLALILLNKSMTQVERIFITALIFYGIMEAYMLNAGIAFPILLIGVNLWRVAAARLASFRQVAAGSQASFHQPPWNTNSKEVALWQLKSASSSQPTMWQNTSEHA